MSEEASAPKRIGRPPTKFFTEEERKQGARDRAKAWALANPEKVKANQEKNKEEKSEYNKNYAIENRDGINAKRRETRQKDPEKSREQGRKFKEENPEKIKEYAATYYWNNAPELREKNRLYREANPEKVNAKVAECHRLWNEANPEEAKARRQKYRIENPEKVAASCANWYRNGGKEMQKISSEKWIIIPANRMRRLAGAARIRAKKKGLPFDEGILVKLMNDPPKNCGCCNVELDYSVGHNRTRQSVTPSLDRIDNNKGYTLENTCVVCFKCNALKSCASLQEIEQMHSYVKRALPVPDSSFLLFG